VSGTKFKIWFLTPGMSSDFDGIPPNAPVHWLRRFSLVSTTSYDTKYQTYVTTVHFFSAHVIDFAAGFANGLLAGIPGRVADLTGLTTDIIDRDSRAFLAGNITGTIALTALSIYAGGACGAPLWLSRALLAIDIAGAAVAGVSIAQNFITYAQTGKLDGWQLFFDALDMLPLLSFAGAGAAKAAGGWNCFIAGTPVLAAAGVIAGERLVAEALPAEYKTWNVPVMLGSGALIFLGGRVALTINV